MPVDEVPSPALNGLSITIELAMFIGVVGMAPRILRSLPEGALRGGWIFLVVVGVISGIGIFGVRLSGGPRVELSPRTPSTSSSDNGLRHQVHEQMVAVEKLSHKFAASRWIQTFVTQDPVKIRTLTRQDLQEERTLCRDMRDCTDRILKVFAEASAKGIAHSTLSDEPGATRAEGWQKTREVYSTTYDYLGLIEQHWDEWIANPIPAPGANLQPWQLEIQRLIDAAAASARQAAALLRSTPPSVAANDAVELPQQLREAIRSWQTANDKVSATRWATLKKDPNKASTRTQQDLQEGVAAFSEVQKACDRIMKILAEAKSKGIDLSMAWPTDQTMTRPELWTAAQQMNAAVLQKFALVKEHWEEWKAQPEAPDEKSMKPWQREMKRLDDVIAASLQEARVASDAAGATPSAAPPPAEVTGLAKELRDLIASWNTLLEKSLATRWAKIDFEDPAQKKTLTRRDFEEAGELRREMSEYQERIVKVLAQAKSQGIDVSAATEVANCLRPEFWRGYQDIDALRLKYWKLIDQHWDEWLTSPESVDANSKPWQREMKRLIDEIDARRNQVKALMDTKPVAAASPTAPASRAPSPPGNNFDQLALQTHMLPSVGDYVIALKRVQATRWVKSPDANSYHPQKITRADLHDANKKLRDLIATIDKLRTDLDAVTVPVPATEKEYWRIKRETSIAFQQLTTLLEENWQEWHVSGIQPKMREAKPWQKEAGRLQGEIDKLKQIEQTSILL